MTQKDTVGQNLRAVRVRMKMNGEEVAKALGMSAAAYRRYERDETTLTVERALALCQLFKCDMNTLCHGSESSPAQEAERVQFDLSEGGEVHISIKVPSAEKKKLKPYKPVLGNASKQKRRAATG